MARAAVEHRRKRGERRAGRDRDRLRGDHPAAERAEPDPPGDQVASGYPARVTRTPMSEIEDDIMAEPGERRSSGCRADGEGEREHPERRNPQHPRDDHEERSARLRTKRPPCVAPLRRCAPSASANRTANTTRGRTSPLVAAANDIVGDDAFEEVSDARHGPGRFLLDPGERALQPFRGSSRQRERIRQEQRSSPPRKSPRPCTRSRSTGPTGRRSARRVRLRRSWRCRPRARRRPAG